MRIAVGIAGALLLQGAAVGWLLPPGRRLRSLVDLFALEGLVLALVGTLLIVDRPFMAARELSRRGQAREGPAESADFDRPRRRRTAGVVLLAGVSLFGLAALFWALRENPTR